MGLVAPATSAKASGQISVPAETTFSGTVEDVKQQECEVCKCIELSVVLKTVDGPLEARLGPKTFLDNKSFRHLAGRPDPSNGSKIHGER